jgi:EAL domain-containing protein (putative c-di-GMP-specific phosphodiesterase class I)
VDLHDSEQVTGVQRIPCEVRPRELPSIPEPLSAETANLTLEQALHDRIARQHAPDLVFQPIVDLQRGVCAGYEVLARFQGPPRAAPERWFSAAHACGLGVELEALVVERALSQRRWLPHDCFLAINIAPEALLAEPIQALLKSQGLSRVVFELTEHKPVADYDLLAHAIREIKKLGALVAVDDAGAGYASLKHILLLRPDFVKVDRALIDGLHQDEAKAALVEMFGGFTSRIDAWLVAEGIEQPAELSRLLQLGVPLAQGYFLGRPEPTMRPLEANLATRIAMLTGFDTEPPAPAPLLEVVLSASSERSDVELQALLAADAELELIPLLDASGRPTLLARRTSHGAIERGPAVSVLASTPVLEILQRAMTRPRAVRFDPVMCCDERGCFLGLIRIERLIEAALPST